MTDYTDLVRRLRAETVDPCWAFLNEAADAIEQLRAELDVVTAQRDFAAAQWEALNR